MDVSVSSADGSSLVRLAGEVDTYTVPDVRAAFDAVALAPGSTVVVDLRDVTFLDSSGLGAVIGLYHRARAAGATLRLLCDGVSLRLVRLTRLDQVIDVDTSPTPDHAVH
ncbi:STAS domain-containing protein [Intrasporangium sp. YIM S08009]|uniref:STAS domain-containing protein n=1 Tax=Intrasporangium zincisolvens TaxID=3080018 RepID=UPI002B05C842|nr:STAS domain-containing protein [Intrasporangium sp. YIM S08009]